MLVLTTCPCSSQPPWSWRSEIRLAPPDAVFARAEARFDLASSVATVEAWSVPGGSRGAGGSAVIVLDRRASIGAALALVGRDGLRARFGLSTRREWAFEVEVPLVQHPAMPVRTVWRAKWAIDFGREAVGSAFLHWSPGIPPRVHLVAERDGWMAGAGSAGVFLARGIPIGRACIQWHVGWIRSFIPWTGAVLGPDKAWRPAGFPASSLWHVNP